MYRVVLAESRRHYIMVVDGILIVRMLMGGGVAVVVWRWWCGGGGVAVVVWRW